MPRNLVSLLLALAVFGQLETPPTLGQCSMVIGIGSDLPGVEGFISTVNSTFVWQQRSAPLKPPLLLVGGSFEYAGGVIANYIASWDGTAWSTIGQGLPSRVRAFVEFNNTIVVGGAFGVRQWMNDQWVNLGPLFNGDVRTLAIFNGELVAGGDFTATWDGATVVNRIARWNGTSWQPLGSGMNNSVRCLLSHEGVLIAGGTFVNAGGNATSRIAKWDGVSWAPMSSGMNSTVSTLTEFKNKPLASGSFTQAGGASINYVATWENGSWLPVGNGPTHSASSLVIVADKLIVAGQTPSPSISRWDGENWMPLPNGVTGGSQGSPTFNSLSIFDGKLVVGGSFRVPGMNVATFDFESGAWQRLGRGMNDFVQTTGVHDNDLFMGGTFLSADDIDANRIVRFDGQNFHSLGSGLSGIPFSIASFDGDLYAGGYFSTAGGLTVNGIARWNAKQGWRDVGGGLSDPPPGNGAPPSAFALCVHQGSLYAGGNFTKAGGVPANFIARWDGREWHPVGSGFDQASVVCMAVHDGKLVAGGFFTTSAGVPVNRIAWWGGTHWQPFGSGMNDGVVALCSHQGQLFAGGGFSTADDLRSIGLARWNGSTWIDLNAGNPVTVWSLASYNGDLIAGGTFLNNPGLPSGLNFIARWRDSVWSPVGGGVDYGKVNALTMFRNELIPAGQFLTAGGQASGFWARWRPECPRGDMDCDQSVNDADIATFVSVLLAPAAATDCQRYLADVTADGDVNGADVSAFVAALKM